MIQEPPEPEESAAQEPAAQEQPEREESAAREPDDTFAAAESTAESKSESTAGVDSPIDAESTAQRPVRRWIGFGLLTVGVLILLSAGWVAWRTYQAYHHLQAAADQVSGLQSQVKNLDAIDLDKAGAAVATLQSESRDARSATSDPLYRFAGHLPWIGPNLRAISSIAETVDELASTTAPSLIEVATSIRPAALAPHNGTIDVAPLTAAAPHLAAADAEVHNAIRSMAAIDRSDLTTSVASAVNLLQSKLTTLSSTTGSAALIGRLAPPMLGAQGVRNYLVVFQNLAEPRATGGIFGSYALLRVDDGRLQIVDQGSGSRDLGVFDPPMTLPADLPPALYGTLPRQYAIDANLTPDFPTAAQLIAAMYTNRRHVQVDGVLSIDPVALSYLLVGLKPITTGGGLTLTSANLSYLLMAKAYALYPNPKDAGARDAFLALATEKAFTAATTSGDNAQSAIKGLRKAMAEHRLLLWSARPAEQDDLQSTGIGGALSAGDTATPTIGVYRNDGTGGKLGYYAGGSVTLTPGSCTPAGRRQATLSVQMDYTAPATGLSPYVLGYAKAGPYVLRTNLLIFAPPGGDVTTVLLNGRATPGVRTTQSGRNVEMITVDQPPGRTAVVTAQLELPAPANAGQQITPDILTTPGVRNWKTTSRSFASC